jgi:hypothetical protein
MLANGCIGTKWIKPSEADLVAGRRDWLNNEEMGPEKNWFRSVRNVVVG